MKPVAYALQSCGLVGLTAGAFVVFGLAGALVVGGLLAVVAGAVLEREA